MLKLRDYHPAPRLEKLEQAAVVFLFRTFGCTVRSLSQYRASHIAVGLPDLLCHHLPTGQTWWFETKRYKRTTTTGTKYRLFEPSTWEPEQLRPDQETFRDQSIVCGQRYFWGGIREAMGALVTVQLATWQGDTIARTRTWTR